MKINEAYYYCFGCHETGDVIDFTGRLFGLSHLEAAKKLAVDFDIDPNRPVSTTLAIPHIQQAESQRKREGRCASVLIDYECILKRRRTLYAPQASDNDWHPDFVAACHHLPQVSYMIDSLYSADASERKATANTLLADGTIDRIVRWQINHSHDKECEQNAHESLVA